MRKSRSFISIVALLITSLALGDTTDEHPKMWYGELSEFLKDFHETALWNQKSNGETYRLSIDASIAFRKTIIRLDRKSEASWLVIVNHEYRNRWITWTRRLKSRDVEELVSVLNLPEFWSMPADIEFVDPKQTEEERQNQICIDGTYWVIEAKVGQRYHGTGAHMCGADGLFVPAGELLINLAGRDIGPTR